MTETSCVKSTKASRTAGAPFMAAKASAASSSDFSRACPLPSSSQTCGLEDARRANVGDCRSHACFVRDRCECRNVHNVLQKRLFDQSVLRCGQGFSIWVNGCDRFNRVESRCRNVFELISHHVDRTSSSCNASSSSFFLGNDNWQRGLPGNRPRFKNTGFQTQTACHHRQHSAKLAATKNANRCTNWKRITHLLAHQQLNLTKHRANRRDAWQGQRPIRPKCQPPSDRRLLPLRHRSPLCQPENPLASGQ